MRPDALVLVRLASLVPRLLGLGRTALHEPHRQQDVERELQVLRLPVLEQRVAEARRREVPPERDRRLVVRGRLVIEVVPAGERLAGDGEHEEAEEDEREAVLPQEAAHQWCVMPTTI